MERRILHGLGWLFGILLVVMGFVILFDDSILAGLCLILAALVLLPPLSTWLEPYPIPVSGWTRGFSFFILIGLFNQFITIAQAEQQREAKEALREQFEAHSDSVEGRIKKLISDSAFARAQALANRYLEAGIQDSTLRSLQVKANDAKTASLQKRLEKKAKNTPASHLAEKADIYGRLVKLDPQNDSYQMKLEYYRDELSSLGPRPEPSSWDGSYRPVEDYLERRLHDPGSLEWEGCSSPQLIPGQGWEVHCKYRANNAFGAKVLNAARFIIRRDQVVSMSEITP